ncbi:hypothetical protein TREMEDRAFT_62095 [Tremella mesenterica DSM 1558]|uniref:uncharacterized protein n=1 Tax=Tremella mesenterica (strain ATCC 24925 / CBS 8224 / DSM 1558 / NBRC 9311 / NRRL Y-6157 / RJB 2259-6 / UBC 559-6) TaxID=578456 RepID=UPI0003F49DCF|nr:uncharacterized protein TREMEDRAFT_62095 [Tremella mesenterica DSM 1558]EIW69244.1 hypothetical protein TREMEDRAFT_62095 [Tremella mesenterica DSM 1558]
MLPINVLTEGVLRCRFHQATLEILQVGRYRYETRECFIVGARLEVSFSVSALFNSSSELYSIVTGLLRTILSKQLLASTPLVMRLEELVVFKAIMTGQCQDHGYLWTGSSRVVRRSRTPPIRWPDGSSDSRISNRHNQICVLPRGPKLGWRLSTGKSGTRDYQEEARQEIIERKRDKLRGRGTKITEGKRD